VLVYSYHPADNERFSRTGIKIPGRLPSMKPAGVPSFSPTQERKENHGTLVPDGSACRGRVDRGVGNGRRVVAINEGHGCCAGVALTSRGTVHLPTGEFSFTGTVKAGGQFLTLKTTLGIGNVLAWLSVATDHRNIHTFRIPVVEGESVSIGGGWGEQNRTGGSRFLSDIPWIRTQTEPQGTGEHQMWILLSTLELLNKCSNI